MTRWRRIKFFVEFTFDSYLPEVGLENIFKDGNGEIDQLEMEEVFSKLCRIVNCEQQEVLKTFHLKIIKSFIVNCEQQEVFRITLDVDI